jgi:hypothetical protein
VCSNMSASFFLLFLNKIEEFLHACRVYLYTLKRFVGFSSRDTDELVDLGRKNAEDDPRLPQDVIQYLRLGEHCQDVKIASW